MKLLVISSAPLVFFHDKWYAYSPYTKEMKIWSKYADELQFCSPIWIKDKGLLISEIESNILPPIQLKEFDIKSISSIINSFLSVIINIKDIYYAMKKADHIHLRCPGNMGLIGSFVQILFPNKIKTTKYAGNWDSKSMQPWTYRLQKYILSNTFLTKNMKVLVYGEWPNQSKNIVPFFTATYSESEKEIVEKLNFTAAIKFIFVGSLVLGKNPLYAIKVIEELIKKGYQVTLDLYGEGIERNSLTDYIQNNQLGEHVILKGNQNQEIIKKVYQESHFVILPSKSEGWPKAIAEGMFWGCVPIATSVSCVPFMLDYGKRGVLLEMDLDKDFKQIENIILNEKDFFSKSKLSSKWSQNYTTDVFDNAIKKLIQQ